MTITALPTPPSRSDPPATFISRADALLGALPTLVSEINNDIVTASVADAGLPITIPLTFSTTTTDADPGAGTIRFNNATQNLTSMLYVDLTSAAGGNPDITPLLDWVAGSTSTSSKGVIKIYEISTPTNYIFFSLTAWTTATGYRKLTVTMLAASAANPFANSDALNFQFWRNADAGSVAGGVTMTNADITGIRIAAFNGEVNNAGTTGAQTITWANGARQKQVEPTGAITYTFNAPSGPCHLQLRFISDGTSSPFTHVWPASVKWLGVQWQQVANKGAVVNFWYDGTDYWASGANQV